MPNRFTHGELVDMALAALREVEEEVARNHGTAPRTKALQFALAFLANGKADRRPFDTFWKMATAERRDTDAAEHGRMQSLWNAAGVIARMHGREPW